MKPSKKNSRKKRKPLPPPQSTSLEGTTTTSSQSKQEGTEQEQEQEEEEEEEESRTLNWLIDAFASASVDQITSAYREAGGDPYKAAGILGAELVDPGEGTERKKGFGTRRPRRVSAASGMVSDVIGRDYLKPSVVSCRDGRRNCDGHGEGKGDLNRRNNAEEAEEFLCSMLGDDSQLGMGVVRDVLGECGCNVEKALDTLLDMSASSYTNFRERACNDYMKGSTNYSGTCHERLGNNPQGSSISLFQLKDKTSDLTYNPLEKEQEFLQCEEYDCRDNMQDFADSKEQPPSRPEIMKTDLQQMVLETLFNIREHPTYDPKRMDWKKVVKKVESFGEGLEFHLASITEPLQNAKNGKGDDYAECRSTARKHWDEMKIFYQKAATAYSRGERAHAAHLSEKGKHYGRLAREADEKASREIFEARNKDIKNTVTIDLHGQHVKPAIGLLKLHLLLFKYIPSIQFLKVITGCGAVGVGKGKLKRTVIGLVKKEGIEWSEEDAGGTLVLRLDGSKEYSFMECSDSE